MENFLNPAAPTIILALAGNIADALMDKAVNSELQMKANKQTSTLFGAALGNLADSRICEITLAFLANLRTTDPNLNYDLERIAREAYLLATLEMVRQAENRVVVASAGATLLGVGAVDTLAPLRSGIEADLKNVAGTLPRPLPEPQALLLDPGQSPADRMVQMRAILRANLDTDAARWLNRQPLPHQVADLLENGWTIDTNFIPKVSRDWFSLIALAFVENLKATTRLSRLFESEFLAEIASHEPQAAVMATFAGFTAQLEKLAPPLQESEDSLRIVLGKVVDVDWESSVESGIENFDTLPQIVAELVNQRALSLAVKRKLTTEGQQLHLDHLELRDRELRSIRMDLNLSQQERAAAQEQLAAIFAERLKLLQLLSARDADYAFEVAEFGKQLEGFTRHSNSKVHQALQSFVGGDRLATFPLIQEILRAENLVSEQATTFQSASKLRKLAALGMLMKDRGELTSANLLTLWQAAQELDPEYIWGWEELRRLYVETGNLSKAREAAAKSQEFAPDDRSRPATSNELDAALILSRELSEDRKLCEEEMAIAEKLYVANPASVSAQRDVSVGSAKLGDVLISAGESPAARNRFEQSLAMREKLAAANPKSTAAQRDLAISLDRLGDLLVMDGDLSAARKRFQQSLAIAERLTVANPTNASAQRDLALSLDRLGEVLVAIGELPAARKNFQQSLAIAEKLAVANPANASAQRDLSVSLDRLGDILVATGELPAALMRFEQSLALAQKLAAAIPPSAEAHRDLSLSLDRLGDLLLTTGKLSEARTRFRQSLAIREELEEANPSRADARRDISVSLDRLGDVAVMAGDLPEARRRFRQSLAIREKLTAANPASASARRDLSVCLTKLGDVLLSAAELPEARKRFEHSLAIAQSLAAANPASPAAQRDLSVSLDRLGELLLLAGEFSDAHTHFEQSLAIAQKLAAASPASVLAQRDLSVGETRLGDTLLSAGELSEAQKRYRQSLAMREKLAAGSPASAAAQRDLSVSLTKLGGVLVLVGDLPQASRCFKQSLVIRQKLAAANPASAAAQRDLSVSLTRLGDLLEADGELADARQRFEQSLVITQKLATSSPANAVTQRDRIVGFSKLGRLTGEKHYWQSALAVAEGLDKTDRLAPADKWILKSLSDSAMAAADS